MSPPAEPGSPDVEKCHVLNLIHYNIPTDLSISWNISTVTQKKAANVIDAPLCDII